MNSQNLIAHKIPLRGKHLIEASAGTGKTFNITRIYLRLLLERELTVQQILVMTFTKDATEELRGRIDSFIRHALNNWQILIESDEYFAAIAKNISTEKAQILLQQALLFLDEAAIFTIHGFCKSVLTQHAFATGVSFNANLEANSQEVVLQATQDWYRQLASNDSDSFLKIAEFWPEPSTLVSQFNRAIEKNCSLALLEKSTLITDFSQLVHGAMNTLTRHQTQLFSYLVDGKPPAEQEKRQQEFSDLLTWLTQVGDDHQQLAQKIPDAFIDGRRFSRSKDKQAIQAIFSQVNLVKEQSKSLLKQIAKAEALLIIRQGIYQIRQVVTEQKLTANMLTFDDLISTLAKQLKRKEAQQSNTCLAQLLFEQFPVALVDEFQDTDPEQFSIIKSIYYQQKETALFMIGDPKQAIYGFRGGDVFAYLSARADCEYSWLMDTNWRSSESMINGYNRLFYGQSFEEKTPSEQETNEQITSESRAVFGYGIEYFPVKPSPVAKNKQLTEQQFSALQFIHFEPSEQKGAVKQSFRKELAMWCANEIVRLLSLEPGKIAAKDIALLVRDGSEALEIKTALSEAGLASVFLSNRANLLKSEQTLQLIQLLKGILFVENERLFSAAVACRLLPFSAEKFYLLQQDQLAWQALKHTFVEYRKTWLTRGFITMALALMHDQMAITEENADRQLTNILHLFELLQAASQRFRQPEELLNWFEQQSKADTPEVETELRLESEANLIRIVTQHGSKGLEYPIVFVPFVTRHKNPLKFGNRNVSLVEYHNEQGQLTLSLDGSELAKKAMADEAYAETIRLLYVAVTRAEKRCYLLTTAFDGYHLSPLGQTLKWQSDVSIHQQLQQLASEEQASIGITLVEQPIKPVNYTKTESLLSRAEVTPFSGQIERDWWLSSFTALSRNIRDNGISTPDRDFLVEAGSFEQSASVATALRFVLAKGAHSGNLLHDILEHLNFEQPDWISALHWPLLKYGELPKGYDQGELISWLEQVIECPFKANSSLNLASLSQAQTLREAEFYFPLNQASTKQLAKLLTDHRNQPTANEQRELVAKSRQRQVELPNLSTLNGMMHGFIDLIFEHHGKYYICDYKSNHLGDDHRHYQAHQLKENIELHHYDLQYLIYALALHRYLATIIVDYDVEQHLGGVYYLYLRGMSNNKQHEGCGVYFRSINLAEINQLDQIFSGQKQALPDEITLSADANNMGES